MSHQNQETNIVIGNYLISQLLGRLMVKELKNMANQHSVDIMVFMDSMKSLSHPKILES